MFDWLVNMLGKGGKQAQASSGQSGTSGGYPPAGQDTSSSGPLRCPACGSEAALPIVYGAPTQDLMQLMVQGQAAPGGAMGRLIGGQAPEWRCSKCRHDWRGGMFVGGSGASVQDAVVLCGITCTAVGIRAEKQWLAERHGLDREVGGEPSGWTVERQALLREGDRSYDMLTIRLPDGTAQDVFFDITCFFGRQP